MAAYASDLVETRQCTEPIALATRALGESVGVYFGGILRSERFYARTSYHALGLTSRIYTALTRSGREGIALMR